MNPYRKRQLVEAVKKNVGWAYKDLPWFTAETVTEAERRRQELLDRLSGALSYSFNGTKPHLGPLSLGCQLCGTAAGIFHFINRQCNRSCFFCPQDRLQNLDLRPWTDNLWFEDDRDFVHYLNTFKIKGIGFTGGEPLLSLQKMISRMKAVRLNCSSEIHLRIYTNGDLLDQDALQQLQAVGLNEIRVNICARGYNLTPVKRARGYVPVVTVEIPVIPEDIGAVKKAMVEMETLGIDHLNLIQLEVSRDNYRSLNLSKYHVSHRPELLPVFESELCSLELMLFHHERNLRMPVSYCGFPYRFEVTNAQRSRRYNQHGLQGWEEVTEAGFIRTLVLDGNGGEIDQVLQFFGDRTEAARGWWCNQAKTELRFHRSLLPRILSLCSGAKIQYHNQVLTAYTETGPMWRRDLVAEVQLSRAALLCWQRLYLDGWRMKAAFHALAQEYPMTTTISAMMLADEMRLLKQIGPWETLGISYPETPLFDLSGAMADTTAA
ncbi:radical SAM protein [bacterium]|nr:radical SAM protein [bacterium]